MENTSLNILRESSKILDHVLHSHFFKFHLEGSGPSSGGPFAQGVYTNGTRKLELHFRHTLGLVRYHFGNLSMTHDSYMYAVLGPQGGNRYPGFPENPLLAFENLKSDLENYSSAFLVGDEKEFARCAEIAKKRESIVGLGRIP